jgi:hypothetical protein
LGWKGFLLGVDWRLSVVLTPLTTSLEEGDIIYFNNTEYPAFIRVGQKEELLKVIGLRIEEALDSI